MRERMHPQSVSVVSSLFVAGVVFAALVVVAHPLAGTFGLLGVGAVALLTRAVWRQVTGRGLSLPGTGGRLRVNAEVKRNG